MDRDSNNRRTMAALFTVKRQCKLQPHPALLYCSQQSHFKSTKILLKRNPLESNWLFMKSSRFGCKQIFPGTLIWWIPPLLQMTAHFKAIPALWTFLSAWIKAMWLFATPPSHIYHRMHMSTKINCRESPGHLVPRFSNNQ